MASGALLHFINRKEAIMGGIKIEADTGKLYPGFRYLRRSYSKWLLELLTDALTLPICAEVLQLDLRPLQKIVVDWWIPSDETQTWEDYEATAWQSPTALRTCIQSFITALDTTPDVYE